MKRFMHDEQGMCIGNLWDYDYWETYEEKESKTEKVNISTILRNRVWSLAPVYKKQQV